MKLEDLLLILAKPAADAVKALKVSDYTVPKWSDLEKQYNPLKHSIWDTVKYPPKLNDINQDDFKRTALGLQKLAVNRIAQSMFSTPVLRVYTYDRNLDSAQQAVDIIEEVLKTKNSIDCTNIERSKKLNAACEVAVVWRVKEKSMMVQGEQSKFTLSHSVYSPKDGYSLYPILDDLGDILVLSIGSTTKDNVERLYVYLNTEKPKVIVYEKKTDWVLVPDQTKDLTVFPAVYINIEEPVWGGLEGTNLVEQLEEMESYQGLYIKRNALPTFTLDYGEVIPGSPKSTTEEKSSDARRVIKLGKGGNMADVTWDGAGEAIDARYKRIRNAFFEQIQVPDTSFANMIASNTSAENKELIFSDARAKAEDLGGEWEKFFQKEMEIVKEFIKVLFPSFSTVLDTISIRNVIRPYNVRTKKETAEFVSVAGNAMSMETKIKLLGEVDDVQSEKDLITEEQNRESNIGL